MNESLPKIYLYLKTHRVTGLKYVGITRQDPLKYLGSGKRWRNHLKKHGNQIDTEILFESFSLEEISEKGLYYSDLLNIVESEEYANLKKETGDGGFDHINNNSDATEYRKKRFLECHENKPCGGTKNWTHESYNKVINQARINIDNRKKNGLNVWSNLSKEDRDVRSNKIRNAMLSDSNPTKNTSLYIDPNYIGPTPDNSILMKYHRFKRGSQPEGWITIASWRRAKMRQSGTFGKSWYNDGVNEILLDKDDQRAYNFQKGRLKSSKNGSTISL